MVDTANGNSTTRLKFFGCFLLWSQSQRRVFYVVFGKTRRKSNKISKFPLVICQIQILLFIFIIELPNIKVVMAPYTIVFIEKCQKSSLAKHCKYNDFSGDNRVCVSNSSKD
jgi:hypothetical protein